MRGDAPALAVVVATHRRPEALAFLLASLRRQTLDPSRFEVLVVVDGVDGSEPAYRSMLERYARTAPFALGHAFQGNAGQSVARHRAIARATARWICIVDDDMELEPEFLEGHLAALSAGTDRTVVIGRVVPEPGWRSAPLHEAVRTKHMLEAHDDMARGHRPPRAHAFVTQNVSFARDFYLAVGGFDERLRLAEDTELGLRLERAGARFSFAPRAAAVHHSRVGSYRTWLERCFEYGRAGVYVHRKLDADARAHPLRNLVRGSRANAIVVHALCWSDPMARGGIALLRLAGAGLRRVGLVEPAIATHKAILAIAFHLGVKSAYGSWRSVVDAERALAGASDLPPDPT